MTTVAVSVPGLGVLNCSPAEAVMLSELSAADDRQRFWLHQAKWPKDALGMVFLGRALERVGAALFPREWTGNEPAVNASLTALPPVSSMARRHDVDRIRRVFVNGQMVGRAPSVDEEMWQQAVKDRAGVLAKIAPARARLAAAKGWLVSMLLSGEITYCVRTDETGAFSDFLPPHTELTEERFYYCRINPGEPITRFLAGTGFRSIFVPESVLDAGIANARPSKASGNPTINDDERLQRMDALIASGEAKSMTAAAGVVAKADPGHSESATKRRLIDKFGKARPDKKRTYHPRDPK
jgi:hypothetical protein